MSEILGNLKGIRNSVIEELKTLYDMKLSSGQLLSAELALKLADITEFINREVSVYITRSGQIIRVAVGSNETVELPAVEGRRGNSRLSGIRCVHTHPNGTPSLSGVDISALKANRFDCMIAIGVTAPDYTQSTLGFGMIVGMDENEQFVVENYGPLTMAEAETIYFPNLVTTVERILEKQTSSTSLAQSQERAVLVGMEYNGMLNTLGWTIEDSVEELKQLADTAGAQVVAKFMQKRPKPDPAFFIGKGKVQELALFVQQENIDLCIFDDELSPAQQRNIEQAMGIRVLDRTALILDIFAQRARTNLQLTFVGTSTLCKDIKNKCSTVENSDAHGLLNIALLRRRKFVVKDTQVNVFLLDEERQLLNLTVAEQVAATSPTHSPKS